MEEKFLCGYILFGLLERILLTNLNKDANVMYFNQQLKKKIMKQFNLLSEQESQEIYGGFLHVLAALAAVAGIGYLAGEIAESAGRQYRKNYL
jgi:hypothetical protein